MRRLRPQKRKESEWGAPTVPILSQLQFSSLKYKSKSGFFFNFFVFSQIRVFSAFFFRFSLVFCSRLPLAYPLVSNFDLGTCDAKHRVEEGRGRHETVLYVQINLVFLTSVPVVSKKIPLL